MNIIKIKELVSKHKQKLILYTVGALLFIGNAFIVYTLNDRYLKAKERLNAANNTVRAYEDQFDSMRANKAVLELTAASLRHSNDSLIQDINKIKKSLKIALNKPGDIAASSTTTIVVRDTVNIVLGDSCEFDTIIKPNELTKFSIKYENNSLIHAAEINNEHFLFVYSSREYVNEYKSGWHRFWSFDWKKRDIVRYNIHNSNDLIKTTNTRVIKIGK